MKNVLKLKNSSKPAESKQEDDVLELYMDYVGDDGYVYRHNGKEYYKTNISLQGPKGNPGPKGRDGYTPNIGENGNWYIAGTDTKILSTPNLKVTKTELKELVENKELVPGIIYSYNIQTPEETTITINQKAISNNKLDSEGIINSSDEDYDGKTVLYDITEEKLNIPSEGLVILIAYDNSKIYMYYDGVLENTYINRGPLTGQAEYTIFKRIDDRQFLALNLSSTDYIAANSSQIPAKYNIHTCPRIKLSYDFDTHKDIIIYTKNGNQIEIDTDSLKQLIDESKLEPGVEYVYKINDLFYETTIRQKAISDNKLDTKGKIVNVNCIADNLKNSTAEINAKKYINSNVVFDIEKDFCLYFNEISYLYIDGVFRGYSNGIANYKDDWFKVDVDINVNTLSATVVSDGGSADFSTGSVIGEEYLINKTIIARPLLTLDCPANHISTIWVDQSYKEQNTVKITGDIVFDIMDTGVFNKSSESTVNVIRWIYDNTRLVFGRLNDAYYGLEITDLNFEEDWHNQFMKLPEFWWKSRNISEDICQVDFCNDKRYIDDTWQHWDGNTFINVFETLPVNQLSYIISLKSNAPNDITLSDVLTGRAAGRYLEKDLSSFYDYFDFNMLCGGDSMVGGRVDSLPLVNLSHTDMKLIINTLVDSLGIIINSGVGFDEPYLVNRSIGGINNNVHLVKDAKNRVSMITYETHCIMAMLFYAFYGTVDANKAFGQRVNNDRNIGNIYTNSDMYYFIEGFAKPGLNARVFWGLYDWWGITQEWIDNLYTLGCHGSVGNEYYEDYSYVDVAVLDYEGKVKRIIHTTNYDEGTHKLILGEYFDLLPRVDGQPPYEIFDDENADVNCGWTDNKISVREDIGNVAARSGNETSPGGIITLGVGFSSNDANVFVGSRLQYHGAWTEVDSFE